MWEFGYISHALFERGLLQDGRKGLGFACGREILPSLFAQYGCQITATDAPHDSGLWEKIGQKAWGISDVFHEDIIDKDKFNSNVDFRAMDMNQIGEDLKDYDFLWSSCALEHLGSLHDAKDFIYRAMKCLKPGGIAVHTTEINLRSQVETKMTGCAILRSIDFIEIAEHLTWKGHEVAPLDFRLDDSNLYEDFAEFKAGCELPKKNHFTLKYGHNMVTSFGLIVRKSVDVPLALMSY